MARTSGRDGRPDALSRLQSSAPPWAPARGADPDVATVVDTPVVPLGVTTVAHQGDRSDPIDETESSTTRWESDWGMSPPPRWLDTSVRSGVDVDSVAVAEQGNPSQRVGRPPASRRGPFVAPPAAIALIAVGVLACIVTAYTVLRGPSDDSPAAARVAFPASAGAAAPSRPAMSASVASSTEARPSPESSTPTSSVVDEVVVSVVGLVRSPGLVRLPAAARVADAIGRAGGGRPGADLLSLNMAQPLRDGDQILVGFADPAGGTGMRSAIVSAAAGTPPGGVAPAASGPAGAASSATTPGPVDLNTADEAALDTLPGVGPVTAKAIIDWRTRNGRFRSVDQLAEVDGIGPGRLAKLRDRVTV